MEAAIPRQGLKTPLNRIEREEIWKIREKTVSIMIDKGIYSKHFARIRLLEWTKKDPPALRTHETLFVDESQDLSAVELMCLKNLKSRSLILAGDTGQSIYGFINPYIRAGLELKQEQIILLKTNHRNTIPIHNLAEKYRKKTAESFEDPGTESYPFREGPDPEVHIHNNPEYLAELLAKKAQIYISDLGYDPESIGILCSRTGHFSLIKSAVEKKGLKTTVIKNPDFMFSEPGIIRLSTLHSSKGLDFPVVLIFLPEFPPAKELEKNYQKRLYRNLIYVAMSRAMDILDIYTTEEFDDNFK
jgi:superfamily I DNA/RNA helicase